MAQTTERKAAGDPASVRLPANHLPRSLTSFVGREQALADVAVLLRSARLVTLTGAGGVGKTRLALELAAGLCEQFRDGVRLVELAPVTNTTHLAQAVAEAIGVKEAPGRPLYDALLEEAGVPREEARALATLAAASFAEGTCNPPARCSTAPSQSGTRSGTYTRG